MLPRGINSKTLCSINQLSVAHFSVESLFSVNCHINAMLFTVNILHISLCDVKQIYMIHLHHI